MNAIVEIDKAGRLVVPKHLRDSMQLVPGTRLLLQVEGETLVIRPECSSARLYKKQGFWVHRGAAPITVEQVKSLIDSDREDRERRVVDPSVAL